MVRYPAEFNLVTLTIIIGGHARAETDDILILDELSVALCLGLLPVDKVVNFLIQKDDALHVIITGRDAPPELIKMADVVTEMKEIKHIYREGVTAIQGLDY